MRPNSGHGGAAFADPFAGLFPPVPAKRVVQGLTPLRLEHIRHREPVAVADELRRVADSLAEGL